MWIAKSDLLPRPAAHPFYRRLNAILTKAGFDTLPDFAVILEKQSLPDLPDLSVILEKEKASLISQISL